MLAQILAELMACASRKDLVCYNQSDSMTALFVNLQRVWGIGGGQYFKA